MSFDDADGVRWLVWQVETPAARAHLLDATYRDGWLVFEREDTQERRRLAQVPEDWAALPPAHLARLCQAAIPARVSPTGQQRVVPPPDLSPDR